MFCREDFRKRLQSREKLVGIFFKSDAYQQIEVLGNTGLDFIILDAEHAPFDPGSLDRCLLAAKSVNLPAMVRVPGPGQILSVLDMGAAGILAPHIKDAGLARKTVAATRYCNGTRGFSGSPRAGGYGGMPMKEYAAAADKAVSVLCQIEDREGVENCDAIARMPGVDCLFIGRADLAMAYNAKSITDGKVLSAVEKITNAARAAQCPLGIFLPDLSEAGHYAQAGVSLFVIGSDQSILMRGAGDIATEFKVTYEGNG